MFSNYQISVNFLLLFLVSVALALFYFVAIPTVIRSRLTTDTSGGTSLVDKECELIEILESDIGLVLYKEIKISTWQYNALCRQHSSNLFFPPATFEKKEDREKREAKAKAVCNGCPVKVNCLEEAKEIEEPFGIWGGLNEVERKRNLIFS